MIILQLKTLKLRLWLKTSGGCYLNLANLHLLSTLKRMSVIVSQQDSSYNVEFLVMSKGIPHYNQSYLICSSSYLVDVFNSHLL